MKQLGQTVGFTLIEMAIVLVVIGLIISGGLLAVSPVLQKSKMSDTYARMDRIEQALIVYAVRNQCLPCPAAPAVNSDNTATAGWAESGGTYETGCKTTTCTYGPGGTQPLQGIVPWVNLGLSEADIVDGFGYRIDYALTSNAAAPNNLQAAGGFVRAGNVYAAGDIVVNNANGAEVTGGAAGTRAAYVLISHGPDHSLGYASSSGKRAPNPHGVSNLTQADNGNGTPFVQNDPIDISGVNYFDDIVRWRSAPMVIQQCGAGACGNPD